MAAKGGKEIACVRWRRPAAGSAPPVVSPTPRRSSSIGHVNSTDVGLSAAFPRRATCAVSNASPAPSDLAVVDEVDGAQAALDDRGIAKLDLFGSTESFESLLLRDVLDPVASGRGFAVSASIENYFLASNRFMRLNRALRAHLLQRMEEEGGILVRFKDAFVTGNSILASMYLDPDQDEDDHGSSRFDHIRRFFERLVMSVLTSEVGGDGEDDLSELDLARVARELSVPAPDLDRAVARFRAALAKLLNTRLVERFEENYDEMRDAFFGTIPPRPGLDPQEARVLFRFLVEVTTVVLQFLALVPAQYAMIAEGVHTERIYGRGVSADMRRSLPKSLIGRLSGIRFGYETDRARTSFVEAAVPLLRGRAAAAALSPPSDDGGGRHRGTGRTSRVGHQLPEAESELPRPGGAFLRAPPRRRDRGLARERLLVQARAPDPDRPGEFVRVSGLRTEGERHRALRLLSDHYFGGSEPVVSQLRSDQFDPGRRTAVVVNSYEQVRFIKAHLKRTASSAQRVIGVARDIREIRRLFGALNSRVGNLPSMPGIFPDYPAPIIRNAAEGREIVMAAFGAPEGYAGHPDDFRGIRRLDACAVGRSQGAAAPAAGRNASDRGDGREGRCVRDPRGDSTDP